MTPEQFQAYLQQHDPDVLQTYETQIKGAGDPRTLEEWFYDHLAENPQDPRNQDQQIIRYLTGATGMQDVVDTQQLPLEQALLEQSLPGLLSNVEGDTQRQALVQQLTGQTTQDYQAARDAISPEANAARLQDEYKMADTTTGRVSDSSAQSAQAQLAALQQSIAAMQGNLTGDLATKAAALQQQVDALNSNLTTLDSTQKATLAQQIATTQKDLEDSITAQRSSLTQEIASLRGAADANSVARQTALQKEIDGLTAAQAPMAKARLDSANALATAVNIGLQGTQDALTATRAKQGYLGTSSFDNANLARAGINARQVAAQALGGAREANAGDLRTINARGATEGRTIADDLAAQLLGISGRSAGDTRTLADLLATGTQKIGDTGAAGLAGIQGQTAGTRSNIGNNAAAAGYQDQLFGADQKRALSDALATGSGSVLTNQALQQQQARDAGTTARQNYFDNAFTRGLSGTLARPGLSSNLASTLTGLEGYGNSGLARSQNLLNWWTGSAPAAPTPGYVPAVAPNTGNDIAGLGAGLVGTAANIAASQNYWQPKQTGTVNGIKVVDSTYDQPITSKNWRNP